MLLQGLYQILYLIENIMKGRKNIAPIRDSAVGAFLFQISIILHDFMNETI